MRLIEGRKKSYVACKVAKVKCIWPGQVAMAKRVVRVPKASKVKFKVQVESKEPEPSTAAENATQGVPRTPESGWRWTSWSRRKRR